MKRSGLSINNLANLWCAAYAAEFVRLGESSATRNQPRNALEAMDVADNALKFLLKAFEAGEVRPFDWLQGLAGRVLRVGE